MKNVLAGILTELLILYVLQLYLFYLDILILINAVLF